MVFLKKDTLDEAEMQIYAEKIWPTFDGHDVKVLVGYGQHEVLEGDPLQGVVIMEFPSLEKAKAWYHSPAYKEIIGHRFKGAVYSGLVAEGFSPQVTQKLDEIEKASKV